MVEVSEKEYNELKEKAEKFEESIEEQKEYKRAFELLKTGFDVYQDNNIRKLFQDNSRLMNESIEKAKVMDRAVAILCKKSNNENGEFTYKFPFRTIANEYVNEIVKMCCKGMIETITKAIELLKVDGCNSKKQVLELLEGVVNENKS